MTDQLKCPDCNSSLQKSIDDVTHNFDCGTKVCSGSGINYHDRTDLCRALEKIKILEEGLSEQEKLTDQQNDIKMFWYNQVVRLTFINSKLKELLDRAIEAPTRYPCTLSSILNQIKYQYDLLKK